MEVWSEGVKELKEQYELIFGASETENNQRKSQKRKREEDTQEGSRYKSMKPNNKDETEKPGRRIIKKIFLKKGLENIQD